jgi:hypothetical protein
MRLGWSRSGVGGFELAFDHERANGAYEIFVGSPVLDERDDLIGPPGGVVYPRS